ncbi:hypothetical protein GCM10009602_08020 [Nocardiopsis tropica]
MVRGSSAGWSSWGTVFCCDACAPHGSTALPGPPILPDANRPSADVSGPPPRHVSRQPGGVRPEAVGGGGADVPSPEVGVRVAPERGHRGSRGPSGNRATGTAAPPDGVANILTGAPAGAPAAAGLPCPSSRTRVVQDLRGRSPGRRRPRSRA